MPWKEIRVLDKRMKFIGRLLSGKKMARVNGVSGSTVLLSYKIMIKNCFNMTDTNISSHTN